MRPPRAVHPVGHKMGQVFGPPGARELQKRVLLHALRKFERLEMPGTIEYVQF